MAHPVQRGPQVGAAHSRAERYCPLTLGLLGLALLAVGITALQTRAKGVKWPVAVPELLTTGGSLLIVGALCFPCHRNRRRTLELNFLRDAQNGDLPGVAEALDRGVTINVEDEYGNTALLNAVSYGHLPVVQRLVEAGADLEARNQNGMPLLVLAAGNDRRHGGDPVGTVRYLLSRNPHPEANILSAALLSAVRTGSRATVQVLLDAGAAVNRQINDLDGTALHEAAAWGRADMAQQLLSAGADVNAHFPGDRRQGKTPLMVAIFADVVNREPMITLLMSALSFDPTVRNDKDQTALDVARERVADLTERQRTGAGTMAVDVQVAEAQRVERLIAARTPSAGNAT